MTAHVEEWRVIAGFSMYEVSDWGRVRRVAPGSSTQTGTMATPVPRPSPRRRHRNGYPLVCLQCKGGGQITRRVHRLVALAFLGDPPEARPHVNHKNGVRTDNRAVNLEWCSPDENVEHSVQTGLQKRGSRLPYAKLDEDKVLRALILILAGWQRKEVGALFGVSGHAIVNALNGKAWSHVWGGHPPLSVSS